jgi:hypothetical protein
MCPFFVDHYNQNIASTETSGMDAKIEPTKELRFATSDMAMINAVVTATFIR